VAERRGWSADGQICGKAAPILYRSSTGGTHPLRERYRRRPSSRRRLARCPWRASVLRGVGCPCRGGAATPPHPPSPRRSSPPDPARRGCHRGVVDTVEAALVGTAGSCVLTGRAAESGAMHLVLLLDHEGCGQRTHQRRDLAPRSSGEDTTELGLQLCAAVMALLPLAGGLLEVAPPPPSLSGLHHSPDPDSASLPGSGPASLPGLPPSTAAVPTAGVAFLARA
jgi:hypothetical protein